MTPTHLPPDLAAIQGRCDAPRLAAMADLWPDMLRRSQGIGKHHKRLEWGALAIRDLLAAVEALTKERDEARKFGEMAAAKYNELLAEKEEVTCAFCGEVYPRGTPRHGDGALTDHIRVCAQHPLRKAEAAAQSAREALDRLRDREVKLEDSIRDLRDALADYAEPETGWRESSHADAYEDSRVLVPDAERLKWLAEKANAEAAAPDGER